MACKQRLISCDDRFAIVDCCHSKFASRFNSTHNFNNQIDIWIINNREWICGEECGVKTWVILECAHRNASQFNLHASASREFSCIGKEQAGYLASDDAAAEHANANWFICGAHKPILSHQVRAGLPHFLGAQLRGLFHLLLQQQVVLAHDCNYLPCCGRMHQ